MKKLQEISRSVPGKPQAFSWFSRLMAWFGWVRIETKFPLAGLPAGGELLRVEGEISDDPKFFEVRFTVEQEYPDANFEETFFLRLNAHQLVDLGDKFTMAAVGLAHGIDGPRDDKRVFPIPLERDDNIEREVP